MKTAIRRKDCTAQTTIIKEVHRLCDLGYKEAGHANIMLLQPKEYFVRNATVSRTTSSFSSVYYREG